MIMQKKAERRRRRRDEARTLTLQHEAETQDETAEPLELVSKEITMSSPSRPLARHQSDGHYQQQPSQQQLQHQSSFSGG